MQLLRLKVHNWGVFREPTEFILEPVSQSNGSGRHLIILTGHNGSGKSTLFQVIALALHGSLALGDRVSNQAYNDFLLSRLHRHSTGGNPIISKEGSVKLGFRYVQSGQPLVIEVERLWRRNGHTVREDLTILQNGEPPDVDPADYQVWLNDLVPSTLASLCFFDAEQLSTLASPARHNGLLRETLHRLLGLDLVRRLQADLSYYTRRRGGGDRVIVLREEVLRHQATLDDLTSQLKELQSKTEDMTSDQAGLEAKLAKQERRLAAEGGSYAARRSMLQEEQKAIQEEIEIAIAQLHELSADLLPFALAPELCQALSQRLNQGADIRRHRAADQLWQERITQFESTLQSEQLWKDLETPSVTRQVLSQRLIHILREEGASREAHTPSLLHHLAESEEEQLQAWITLALYAIPQQAESLGQRLGKLQSKHQHIEVDLSRVPDDEIVVPIHEEITRLEAALADLQKQQKALNEQIGALEFQRNEQARALERAAERLRVAQAGERQLELAERSRLALIAYQDALIRQRLQMLEDRLVAAFNTICRKEHLLKAAHINPDDFDVQLRGTDGHMLGLSDFSAGERQLYAMALLWALRQVSGQELPLVIDTPLARLDEIHRWRLVHDYLPAVSNQVVLFTTDVELDTKLMAQVEPYQARVYRLDYDALHEKTGVTCQYQFKPKEATLPRTEAVGEPPISIPSEDMWTSTEELINDA